MSQTPPPPPGRPSRLNEATGKLRAEISAYPGSITYVDLMRKNKRESVMLMVVMVLLGVVLGGVISGALTAYAGASAADLLPSVVLGAAAALVVASLGATWSWFGGDSAILAMSGAREITKPDDPQLFNVVEECAIAAGLPVPRVYLINDTALNAFATGRDPQHASVAITTGLRNVLNRDELQGVIAHEVAHIRHYDVRFAMLMATMVGLIVFASDAFRRILWYAPRGGRGGSRGGGKEGGGAAVAILFIAAILLSILAPIFAFLIQMAYSRQREFLADAGAVEITRNPEGLASALLKLADDPEPLVDTANRGTAHLFIVNPLKRMHDAHQSLDSMFLSHPPIQKRVARLMALTR
ncbi:MAG: M48 family metallopeptidase [Phycisphaeraceae bacterium]|nr:M48 family metallopeptidase [Phycisphaeraceae bacterium]